MSAASEAKYAVVQVVFSKNLLQFAEIRLSGAVKYGMLG